MIYSAMHMGTRANFDPAVWAPIESSLRQTVDEIGELKREECWEQHTEAVEAQRNVKVLTVLS